MMNNTRAIVRKYGAKIATGVTLAVPAVMAFAQSTDPVTDAMTAQQAKIAIYGAALVLVAVAGVGFGVGIKYVKKIRGAS